MNVDQIKTQLGHDEGQFSIVSADEQLKNMSTHEVSDFGWTFFMNATGTSGYALRMDAPSGQPFQQACVQYKLHDITLYDNRIQQKSPLDFLIANADKAKAVEGCKGTQSFICGFHNDWMHEYAENMRLNVTIKATDSDGNSFLLMGSGDDKLHGNISITSGTATLNTEHAFHNVRYRPNGIKYLNERH